jgi:hypothetical protein
MTQNSFPVGSGIPRVTQRNMKDTCNFLNIGGENQVDYNELTQGIESLKTKKQEICST